MYTVYEKKSLLKTIKTVPLRIKKAYELWKRIVEFQGVQGLRAIKGYHDEALKGDWQGFRSSTLSLQWQIIYKVEKDEFVIYVIDMNAHKY